jgi:hypothetical protein
MEIPRSKLATSFTSPRSHNPKVAGSNPAPATTNDDGLADAKAASPFCLPDFTQESGSSSGDLKHPPSPALEASASSQDLVP